MTIAGRDGPWIRADDSARRGVLYVRPPLSPSPPITRGLIAHAPTYSAIQVVYPLLAGLGIGGLFVPPLIALQAAMPGKDMATSTATYGLIRQLGATIGVSVGQAVWSSVRLSISLLPSHLPPAPFRLSPRLFCLLADATRTQSTTRSSASVSRTSPSHPRSPRPPRPSRTASASSTRCSRPPCGTRGSTRTRAR